MGDPFFFGPLDNCPKGLFQNPEEAIHYFGLVPEKTLEALNPFKIRYDDPAGITENVRKDEYFVPALE